MFKNVRFYRLTSTWPDSEEELTEALSTAGFRPCGPLTEKISGWEPPGADPAGPLGRRLDGADLLQLRTQSRLLPSAAINEALEERIEEFRDRMGQEPGRRERRRLKEQTRDNLLPNTLLRSERTKGFLFLSEKIFAIDASTPAKAEQFLGYLRAPLGSVNTTNLTFKRSLADLLKQIFLGDAPGGIKLGRECRMQDASDTRSRVHWVDMDLTDASIRKHVRDGMRLTHLAVEVGSVMSCVIDETGALSKVRLLGMDAKEETEDPQAKLDAEFVLLTGTLRWLIDALAQSLGGIDSRN
jgi:recombination associated protein RdgC